MPEVSCYSMDLYCDQENSAHTYGEFPHTYTGHTRGQCLKPAKTDGWTFHRDGAVSCPKCKGKKAPTESTHEWG